MKANLSHRHFSRHPQMKPWIGDKYQCSKNRKLLIVGESHYLPSYSGKSKVPSEWYSIDASFLDEKERLWTCPEEIIERGIENNFSESAHVIYKNICHVINEVSFRYRKYAKIMNHLAFINYFQRPAESTGESIEVSKTDIKIAKEVICDVADHLRPDLVAFVSRKASRYGKSVIEGLGIPVTAAPHPGCAWWNRTAKKYGGGYGRDIIPKFIEVNGWYTCA
jgi:hypothetical protein